MADPENEPGAEGETPPELSPAEQKKRDKAAAQMIEQAEADRLKTQEDADKALTTANAAAAAADSASVQVRNQAISDQQLQADPTRQVQMWPPAELNRAAVVPAQEFEHVQQKPGLSVAVGVAPKEG